MKRVVTKRRLMTRTTTQKKRKTRTPKPIPTVPDIEEFHRELLSWYDNHCRELPWRRPPRSGDQIRDMDAFAYRVWVSEVMLQQTQVVKVVDYFKQWMEKWPKVEDLAKADLEDVREVWAGLGYYSRATNLLKGAQFIMETFNGVFPSDVDELMKIPGVGAYTSRAIASIAKNVEAAVVDGNVIRVLARLHTIDEDPKKEQTFFQELADAMLNHHRPGDHNQAMMELGALICRPMNPQCEVCPVKSHCKAYKELPSDRQVTSYPISVKRPEKQKQTVNVCILCLVDQEGASVDSDGWYLMVKRPATGLLAGMWEFPTTPALALKDTTEDQGLEAMNDFLQNLCGADFCKEAEYRIIHRTPIGQVVHIFSHIQMTLKVESLLIQRSKERFRFPQNVQYKWVKASDMNSVGMCSMVKKVFNLLKWENTTTKQKLKTTTRKLEKTSI